MINFFLNGKEYSVNKSVTINKLLNYFNYNNQFFVLEYNKIICNKENWNFITINSNDKIEIITIVGGG